MTLKAVILEALASFQTKGYPQVQNEAFRSPLKNSTITGAGAIFAVTNCLRTSRWMQRQIFLHQSPVFNG